MGAAIHQAFWRWHFYAGLIVMPMLMLLALTGGVYLFQDEINGIAHRSLLQVEAQVPALPPQAWADAATAVHPGRVASVLVPGEATQSAQVVIETASGVSRAVFVDPYTARVLGVIDDGGLMQVVKRLHSLDLAGPVANLMVEVVAGWAIVMVATGIVLWWPKGGAGGGLITIRGKPRQRLFWRDLHAVVGIFAGLVVVFLAATGMPWSAVWGKEVRRFTTEAGWGRPAAPSASGEHAAHGAPSGSVPWALEETLMADMPGMDHHHHQALTLDTAAMAADERGLPLPYVVSIPAVAGQAWTASYMPAKAEGMRTLYLSPSTGMVLGDIGYRRFGPAAKSIEWGIAVHQGKQYGLGNKLIMLAGCVAIWLLGVSGVVMWWKRRPTGRLAAPPPSQNIKANWVLTAVVAPLAVLYPLVAASLGFVLVLDVVATATARVALRRR